MSTSTGDPILYTAAAGDDGHAAAYPAASPNVIGVGGTTLNGCSGTSCAGFTSETAWSDSGGGVSAYEKIPAYQSAYGGPVYGESSGGISALTGGMRAIPDVSFDANPNTGVSVYDSTAYNSQSGWFTLGGTSVGTPNWAGILAVGASTAGMLQGAQKIYGGGYGSYLRDIISGTNGSCGTDCTAGTGYDLVTGLGSPINYPTPPTIKSSSAPQGNWVGTYGGSGYALAAWNGSSMRPTCPTPRSVGSRLPVQWATSTTDVHGPRERRPVDQGGCLLVPSTQLELQLSFSSAYSGNLELYALDWDSTSRQESISVSDASGTQTAGLATSFNEGAWMVFPISVASGGSVTINVQDISGANAVLSGIFLGGPGVNVSSAPQGNWVGTYGGSGYALAAWNGSSDATYLPDATLSLVQGSRYQWATSTTDVQALESDDQSTREAACWSASTQLELQLSFSSAYSGNLELYALDWDSTSRQESISVSDASGTQTAGLATSFNEGAWMVFPISVASGGSVTINVQDMSGANAVLSGIFLGGPGIDVSSAPQGNWVGTYGGSGYAVAAWNGSSDATYLPDATLSWFKAPYSGPPPPPTSRPSRATTSRPGRLPAGTTTQLELQLSFSSAYSGNLELYALDWDSTSRQESISVSDA